MHNIETSFMSLAVKRMIRITNEDIMQLPFSLAFLIIPWTARLALTTEVSGWYA